MSDSGWARNRCRRPARTRRTRRPPPTAPSTRPAPPRARETRRRAGRLCGQGISRQRQNFGAVGQVTRAMVVVSASWRMVILLPLEIGERLPAGLRRWSRPPAACRAAVSLASWALLDGRADALGQLGNVGLAQGGDRNRVVHPIHGHRFQRRVLGQRVRDRTRQALARVRSGVSSRLRSLPS